MKFVIKHTDEDSYVRCYEHLAFWEEDINEATEFSTKIAAEITIERLRIPYVTAVEKK